VYVNKERGGNTAPLPPFVTCTYLARYYTLRVLQNGYKKGAVPVEEKQRRNRGGEIFVITE
jgi:hypothetical protein